MFNRENKRQSMKRRAGSISAQRLEEENRKDKKAWLWDPDEITAFGNRRLLRSVLLPEKEAGSDVNEEEEQDDVHDWLACLVTDSYYETVEIFNAFTKLHLKWGSIVAKSEKDKKTGFPRNSDYKWKEMTKNGNGSQTEKQVSYDVATYVQKVFGFFMAQMENDDVFPADDFYPFPSDFKTHAKELNTLLFRVLAIMMANEDPSVHKLAKDLKSVFHKVLYYSWSWKLLDASEEECIQDIVEPVREQYKKDYEAEVGGATEEE